MRTRTARQTAAEDVGEDVTPTQRLSYAEAARILGVTEGTVAKMVARGDLKRLTRRADSGLLRADVERLSLARWRAGAKTWLTATQVAKRLGLTEAQVQQRANAGHLPFARNPAGRQLFRPGQIAGIARARRSPDSTQCDVSSSGTRVAPMTRRVRLIYQMSGQTQAQIAAERLRPLGAEAWLLPGPGTEVRSQWLAVNVSEQAAPRIREIVHRIDPFAHYTPGRPS